MTSLTSGVILVLLAFVFGGGLGILRLRASQRDGADSSLTTLLDEALPQLQCGDCGYPGCRPYAEAIARDEAPINLCPPGGVETASRLASIINMPTPPMPPARLMPVAHIRGEDCVGCALCLPVCPTDAIIGAPQKLHEVLAEHCVGCGLCEPACPTDCITMVDAKTGEAGS